MTELRENCTWRRCNVSRARLKLHEVRREMSRRRRRAEIAGASTFARLKYLCPSVRKARFYLDRSRLFSTHFCPFICIALPPGSPPRKRGITLCYQPRQIASRHPGVKSEIRNV